MLQKSTIKMLSAAKEAYDWRETYAAVGRDVRNHLETVRLPTSVYTNDLVVLAPFSLPSIAVKRLYEALNSNTPELKGCYRTVKAAGSAGAIRRRWHNPKFQTCPTCGQNTNG